MFANDYASNFNDVGCYIGGCAQLCNQEIRDSHSEYNALGYPGTNSGGTLLFEYNKFDNDRDGFDTNSQNNSDWPSPQNGACINGVKPPVKGAKTCWVLYHKRSTTTTRTFRWQELVLFGQHPRGGAIVPRDVNNPVSRYD